MKNRVFLGGTCNESTWRKVMENGIEMDYFNPVVEDWNEECRAIEADEKANKCNIHLYVITSAMTGVYSIAEVIDSVHSKGKKTIFHVIPKGFNDGQLRSLKAVVELVKLRGGEACVNDNLGQTIKLLNNFDTT